MKKFHVIFLLFYLSCPSSAQIAGKVLLDKTIHFHDPKGNWSKLNQRFLLRTESPNRPDSVTLDFDNRRSYFRHANITDGKLIERIMLDTVASWKIDGQTTVSDGDQKKYRLAADRIKRQRDYYTYLFGLPMKLRDAGTKVADEVKSDTFNGKTYLVLKVDYEAQVGKDSWLFYINPTTFAMEGYRFYHNREPNDGEFIVCEGLIEVQKMKIPRRRLWYINKDNKYLATDFLERAEPLK